MQSGAFHVLVLAMIWSGSRFPASQPRVTASDQFTRAEVVYYTPSEYLPPLDTLRRNAAPARKANPEYSAQPIISVPPEVDNERQTIVTPPKIRLHNDVAMPNVVAFLEKLPGDARMPIAPAPAVPASEISRIFPRISEKISSDIERSIIAPPPAIKDLSHKSVSTMQAAVIAPPPDIDPTITQRKGDINIGRSSVIAPAPQLAVEQQFALPNKVSGFVGRESSQVIAPPPSLGEAGHSRSSGGMIALSLHPAVGAPPDATVGNRRGSFAATPEGHHGASGAAPAANNSSAADAAKGSDSGKKTEGNIPTGLWVGKVAASSPVAGESAVKNSNAYAVNPKLIASLRSPRLGAQSMQSESDNKLSEEERSVFGNRKFYSLSLNMPNLNSAGGSWVIRFAALRPESESGLSPSQSANGGPAGELSAPTATRKVDPAYPMELMRQNLAGTVILYAVIHADGTVGSVRVLRSVDDRLDQYAAQAIAKWKFEAASRNGAPVDVEATFWIPFQPTRVGSNY